MEITSKIKDTFAGLTKNNAQSAARLAWIIGGIAVVLLVFQVGMAMGYHKAENTGRWGDTYYRTFGDKRMEGRMEGRMGGRGGMNGGMGGVRDGFGFGKGMNGDVNTKGPLGGMMGGFMDPAYMDTHGAAGKVVRIALPEITLLQPDGTEKSVVIAADTVVRERRETVTSEAIKVDGYAVVLGTSDADGRIAAKLIRIMPMPLPGFSTAPSNK